MHNKKIISLVALIISLFIHSVILSVPAYLYFIQSGKAKNNIFNQNHCSPIEASVLPNIKIIGDKSIVKKTANKKNKTEKIKEIGDERKNPGATAGVEETDCEMLVFYDYIKRKIQENKKYPYPAKKENIEGIVEMQFSINECGLLKDVAVIHSSGYKILDEEAVATIKRASPYPAIPKKLNTNFLQLQVKLIYKID